MSASSAVFPIRYISEVTGVLTVTLRAWERRYGLLKPTRTEKGHRLYSPADIERVQLILSLLKQGLAIGQVKQVIDHAAPVVNGVDSADSLESMRSRLASAALAFDLKSSAQIIHDAGQQYPMAMLGERLVRPVLYRLIQSSDAIHLAAQSILKMALQHVIYQRVSRFDVRSGRSKGLIFAGMPNEESCISYDIACGVAAESQLAAWGVGHQVPLAALLGLIQYKQAKGLVLWGDAEPADGWEASLLELQHACSVPLFIGGELAVRHHVWLQEIAMPTLTLDMEENMEVLKQHV